MAVKADADGSISQPVFITDNAVPPNQIGVTANPLVTAAGNTGGTADQVQGNDASGATDVGNPVKVGGVYNAPLPTFTTGQRGDMQLDSRGGVQTVIKSFNGITSAVVAPISADGNGNTAGLYVDSQELIFNGSTWDRLSKPNLYSRIASSAASGSPTSLKASAGNAMGWWGINTGGTNVYLQIYNKASAPVIGTDTPAITFPIAANANFNQTIPNSGLYLGTGVAFAFTTDVAATTAAGAGAITSFLFMAS